MAKRRGFTLVAVLSLALGIGANTTIFSLLNGILLRTVPVADPLRLAAVYSADLKNSQTLGVSYLNYKDFRSRNTIFSNLALYTPVEVSLTGAGAPLPVMAHLVSGNYFQTVGVSPIVGRAFLPEEDATPNARAVAVISYGLWSRLFAGDRRIASLTLTVSGRSFSVVGVAPEQFRGINELYGADLWIPMAMYPQIYPAPAWVNQRRAAVFSVIGRLKPGVNRSHAEGEMQSLAAELAREYPSENNSRGVKLAPVAEAAINAKTRAVYSRTGVLLLVISGIVLLIACGNMANLLLVRSAGRVREFAVRIAIGAGRWQLIRQLLVESLLLSVAGGAVGLAGAQVVRGGLWALRPPSMRFAAFAFELDWRVLAYTFGIALLTGILFGLPPAFGASRSDLSNDLKERAGAATASGGRLPARAILATLQLAFSLVALTGAGLFVRSVEKGMALDPGFDAAHLAAIGFNCADQGYNEARGREYRRLALERASAVPGVEAVGLAKDGPFSVGGTRTVLLEGREDMVNGAGRATLTGVTYPGYFQTVRIPMLRGRDFSLNDSGAGPRVAVVNETAARFFWPGQEAVGKVIEFAGENRPVEIVGVVRTAAYQMPGETPQAMVYLCAQQYYFGYGALYIRARDTAATLAAVQRELRSIDPNLYLDGETVSAAMRKTLWAQSLSATLLSAFGGLSLLLSAIGIYGVTAYGVGLRVREIGVRMAMGAEPRNIEAMLVREGLRLVAAGVGIGMLAAIAVSRWLESMLVGVTPSDLQAFAAAAFVLSTVAIAACWLPARRAAHIDPSSALRSE